MIYYGQRILYLSKRPGPFRYRSDHVMTKCGDEKKPREVPSRVRLLPLDLTAEASSFPSTDPSARPMMDNWAADVSGSSPLITVSGELPDWRSSPPLRSPCPTSPSIIGRNWKLPLSVSDQSVDGIGADEMRRFERCVASRAEEDRL